MSEMKLALFGGTKSIKEPLEKYNSIGSEEVNAVTDVVQSGVLSQFVGGWCDDFLGGPKVKEFERECEKYFNVKHAISVNSWTSGLIAAVGAIGIEPGDEIIVTPWTMCASATAILHWNAIPVFADIDPDTYNLDPKSVVENITPYTKAIMAVDIFGQSANMTELNKIAKKYNLKIISDTAQAPGAKYNNEFAGTLADVGGYSLNYHKHIHTGEGGVIVTNNDELAERLQLIRNHAEAVVGDINSENKPNMVGYNFRLGEIECAIGIEQLKKLKNKIERRQVVAERLSQGLKGLDGLITPVVQLDSTHVYYVYPMKLNLKKLNLTRDVIVNALAAEGIEGLMAGYVNVHLLPMYQNKQAFGTNGFPWSSDICKREVDYSLGICPVAEELHNESFLGYEMCLHELTDSNINEILFAFKKVWSNLYELKEAN